MTNIPKILSNNLDQVPKVGKWYERELNKPEVCKQIQDAFDKYDRGKEQRDEDVEIKDFHKKDKDEVKFRQNIGKYILSIKGTDAFGLGKIKRFHYLKGGDVGVVFKFETEDSNVFVFKTSLHGNEIEGESEAGLRRSQQGANVRKRIRQGNIDIEGEEHPYIVFPYIHEPIDHEDLNQEDLENIYKQIGENMALMNNVKGEGFGDFKVIDGKLIGKEKIFKSKKRIKINEEESVIINEYLIDNNIFEKEYLENILDKCTNIINKGTRNGENTSLLHKDLSFANMFILPSESGPKALVSDTAGSLGHPMDSLGLTIAKNAYLNNSLSEKEQDKIRDLIILGYRNNGGIIDEDAMNATMFLSLLNIGVRAYTKGNRNRSEKVINLAKKIAERI